MKKIIIISIFLNVMLFFYFLKLGGVEYTLAKINGVSTSENTYYSSRVNIFENTQPDSGCIIFFGDSHIDYAEWDEIFPGKKVYNRGISGDNTLGALNRVIQINKLKPSKVFIELGTNDLASHTPIDTIIARYETLLDSLKEKNLGIYVISIPPIKKNKFFNIETDDVVALNNKLSILCKKKNIKFIDIFLPLRGKDNLPLPQYTYDGVHLNGNGYSTISKKITI